MIGALIYALFGITQIYYASKITSLLRNERFSFIYIKRKHTWQQK